MKIQYCSDLHLEFPENRAYLKDNPIEAFGDVLVLAGDIAPLPILDRFSEFFDFLSDNFEFTYWVPGNHEYYRFNLAEKSGEFKEKIRSNLFLANNISVEHGTARIILSTLWSKIDPENRWQIERGMNDFRLIRYGDKALSPATYNSLFQENFDFIQQKTREPWQGQTIVATHHVPTLKNYPPEFVGSALNQAFAVELSPFIETSGIDYWIYGHHHRNIGDFSIGGTRLRTNQLGYVGYNEHIGFEAHSTIEP